MSPSSLTQTGAGENLYEGTVSVMGGDDVVVAVAFVVSVGGFDHGEPCFFIGEDQPALVKSDQESLVHLSPTQSRRRIAKPIGGPKVFAIACEPGRDIAAQELNLVVRQVQGDREPAWTASWLSHRSLSSPASLASTAWMATSGPIGRWNSSHASVPMSTQYA